MKKLTRDQMQKVLGGLSDSFSDCTATNCSCTTDVGCSCSANEPGHAKLCKDSPIKTLN